MIKKALILTTQSEFSTNTKEFDNYIRFADEHGLEIQNEMHYPPVLAYINPESLVDTVVKLDPDVVIANDVEFLIANAYHQGRLMELFEKHDIIVVNSQLEVTYSNINEVLNSRILKKIDDYVNHCIEETFSEREENVGIITTDASREELRTFASKLNKKSNKVCFIEIPEFVPEISRNIDSCISLSHINHVIIFDNELLTPSMKQYLFKLSSENNINISFEGDCVIDEIEDVSLQGMTLN